MSDEIAIRVKNLGKRYKLGHQTGGYKTLGETITNAVKSPFRRLQNLGSSGDEAGTFWALKDVSFDVKKGEVIGIIGRNGAGKSTLLKILSRITSPTEGTVEVHGRIGSLLEVGTGFHPELTGRENIYLSGSIMGMKRAEIEEKFDDIVKFSEIEKFLDTPVKRYSSGMYVRLAFAVAAHLEPEILIVDEVLAVGDAEFQKKCLGKMGDVAKHGRTVLFVSHNMAAVNELCSRGILLNKGKIEDVGETNAIISRYLNGQYDESEGDIDLRDPNLRKNSLDTSLFKWKRMIISNSKGVPSTSIALNEPFEIQIFGELTEDVEDISIGFGVMSGLGFPLFNSHLTDQNLPKKFLKGDVAFKILFDPNFFGPGIFTFDLGATGGQIRDWIPIASTITIEPISRDGEGIRSNYDGVILYPCKWTLAETEIS